VTARHARLLLLIAVCLVAANMRLTIGSVGPLLDEIARDHGASPAALGTLAAVPLITWGIISPFAHAVGARLGLARTISWSLLVLAIGTVWRSLPGSPTNLWVGTIVIGAALALGNVLMPAAIKRDFSDRVTPVIGVYTALLSGSGAVAAGIAVPLSQLDTGDGTLGWRMALMLLGVLTPVALAVWMVATRGEDAVAATRYHPVPSTAPVVPQRLSRRMWRDRLAWLVAGYMGTQSAVFYMMATWVAPIETSMGRDPVLAGIDVMLFQLCGIIGSLTFPFIFRGRMRRILPVLVPLAMLLGAAGTILLPAASLLWMICLGLASGTSLSVAVSFTALRSRDTSTASALSGMSQSIGYLIAACGPILFGTLHDLTGAWLAPLGLLAVLALTQAAIGVPVARERFVLEPKQH